MNFNKFGIGGGGFKLSFDGGIQYWFLSIHYILYLTRGSDRNYQIWLNWTDVSDFDIWHDTYLLALPCPYGPISLTISTRWSVVKLVEYSEPSGQR